MSRDEAFLKRLLATFKIEAAEHIAAVSSGLLELEKTRVGSRRAELIETVFREVHSLKGAARTVNMGEVESVCRCLENTFSALKRRDMQLGPNFFDLLHKTLDLLRGLLGSLETGAKGLGMSEVKGLVSALEHAAREMEERTDGPGEERKPEPVKAETALPKPQPFPSAVAETIRVEKAKLDSVLLQAEGLLQAKQSLGERASDLQEILAFVGGLEKKWVMGRDTRRVFGSLLRSGLAPADVPSARLLEFLESGRELVRTLHGRLAALEKKIENDHRSVGAMVDSLLDQTKRVLMTPFSTLFEILPRTVRDLLSAHGKEAELTVSGGEVEVDRRILEEMKDPLIHLVRNCVDHGIEKPRERVLRGRAPAGRISISVSHRDSGKIELVVADDGPGIDIAKVKNSAVRLGILSPEDSERLDEERLQGLIFRSGVSTSPLITDISGRGLGLAIVQEKVERLGGSVMCESSVETGTVFSVLLPLSLATVRGLLVRDEERLFVIPEANVRRLVRRPTEDIRKIEGRETVAVEDGVVPLVHLGRVLELPLRGKSEEKRDFFHAVVLESGDTIIAFKIDEVLLEQEFLLKPLGKQLKRVRNVSGATVLGGGRVVPVLNVPDLMKSAVKVAETTPSVVSRVPQPEAKKSVLVVEDSVTARILLKNILEAAGYEVKTAVDGMDAYALLKSEPFDLVVSDVDMPRMDGFLLTTKIRSDKILAELPVVLVTALDSQNDRERGIEVGANAYIVKSSFDQSNLLEVIRRLI